MHTTYTVEYFIINIDVRNENQYQHSLQKRKNLTETQNWGSHNMAVKGTIIVRCQSGSRGKIGKFTKKTSSVIISFNRDFYKTKL